MNSYPGNSSFKSLIWVMIYDLSLSDSFNLIGPFETRNGWINLFAQSFLYFRQSILYYLRKLSFIYIGYLIPIEDKSIHFKVYLTFWMLFASFRLENFTMAFLSFTWQTVAILNVGRVQFDIQFFEQLENCVFHF